MPRPKKDSSEVKMTLGVSVLPDVEAEIQAIASKEDRTKSWVGEKLLLRGLAAYREDGRLIVEDSPARIARTTSGASRKTSSAGIRQALDTAFGFNGEPLSEADRQTIERLLESHKESNAGSRQQKASQRKRARKA